MYYILVLLPIFLIFVRKYFNGPITPLKKNLSGKVAIITGSSAGIGKETAKELLNSGATVIFACRDEKKTKHLIKLLHNNNAIFIHLDLSSFESVLSFIKEIKLRYNKIDFLINNAGIFPYSLDLTVDNIESSFQVNHLSHTLLSAMLLELLKDGIVINVSSDAYKFAKFDENFLNEFKMFNNYGISKLANIFLTQKLVEFGICASSVHPGGVYTEISRVDGKPWYIKIIYYIFLLPIMMLFFKDELMGAQTTLHCCYIEKNLLKGGYYANCANQNLGENALNERYKEIIGKKTSDLILNSQVYRNEDKLDKELCEKFIKNMAK